MRADFTIRRAMPYNLGMNQLTIVLPFALPMAELAKDLIRAMNAPALAALLSRTNSHSVIIDDSSGRALPHENWLARALGLQRDNAGPAPFAQAAMRGYGLPTDGGCWFLVHPVTIQIARKHLQMDDPRHLTLDEADGRALFDAARPYFDELGTPLVYGDARTWFVRADDWAGLDTASPDAATGHNLSDWTPQGANALPSRKLQNEVQMLWYENAVNEARQQRGLGVINSFWMWGGAAQPAPKSVPVFTSGVPPWTAALAEPARRDATLDAILNEKLAQALVVVGSLSADGLAEDWSSWLMHMQQLEQQWFVPLLAAVKDGRIGSLKLVLSNRDRHAEFSTSKNAQRKFWRTITLNKLST